jgi:hypothetical protein
MADQNTDDPDKGAVLRWCINCDREDNISLELLSLPASSAAISGRHQQPPHFQEGHLPRPETIRLQTQLELRMIYGPKPILFSPNPKKTIKSLLDDKQKYARFIKGNRKHLHNKL